MLYGLYGFTVPLIIEILISDQNLFILPSNDLTIIASYVNLNIGFTFALSPAYFLFGPIIGAIADFDSLKKFILFGLLAFIISYTLFYFAIKYHLIFLILTSSLLLTVGLLTAPLITVALTHLVKGIRRKQYLSISSINITVLMLAGQLSFYFIYHPNLTWFNDDTPILIAIISYIVLFFFLLICLPNIGLAKKYRESITPIYLYKAIHNIFFRKRACLTVVGLWVFQFIMGVNFIYIPLYLHKVFQYKAMQIGVSMYCVCFYMIVGALLYFYLIKKMSLQHLYFISLVLMLIGLLICAIDSNIFYFKLGVIPIAIGISLGLSAIWSMLVSCIKVRYRGFAICLAWSGCALAWMSSGMLSDFLFTISPRGPFYLALTLVLTLISYTLANRKT